MCLGYFVTYVPGLYPDRETFIHDEGDGSAGSTDAQGLGFIITFDLNASDATWGGEKTLRVAKQGYVPRQGFDSDSGSTEPNSALNQSSPVRKGYLFTGWYTEAGEANQNQATRFRFDGEQNAIPTYLAGNITLYAGWVPLTLEGVVKMGKLPSDLSLYDEVTQAVLGSYKAEATYGASVSAVFVTLNGGSDPSKRDGKSWERAWAASQLKEKLDKINDASAYNVYLVLVAAGEYKAGKDSEIWKDKDHSWISYWLSMKDEVAIVGGWDGTGGGGSWKRGPSYVTNFKGGKAGDKAKDIVADIAQSKKYSVFYNKNVKDKATLAYATVSDGRVDDGYRGAGMHNKDSSPVLMNVTFSGNLAGSGGGNGGGRGSGMFNDHSSPSLTNVIFSGNSASGGGGAMENYQSSPVLMNVTFSANSTSGRGGAMYNDHSSPVLTNVTFSGNSADGGEGHGGSGGAMYNSNSSPVLTNVTFSGNSAGFSGGAMDNSLSSPLLMSVTFSGNSAGYYGGAMDNNNNDKVPTIVNSLFWGNTVKDQTQSSQIYLYNAKQPESGSESESIKLYNCIIEGGLRSGSGSGMNNPASAPLPNPLILVASSTPTTLTGEALFGGISVFEADPSKGDPVTITHENVYGASAQETPSFSTLDRYGGSVETVAIGQNSFAINKGLYLSHLGEKVYYSKDNSSWFTRNGSAEASIPLPSDAIDVTATDARGYRRVGKPDIGAYEFGGVAP